MNNSSYQSTPHPPQPIPNFGNSLALSVGVLLVFLLIVYASYKCRRPQIGPIVATVLSSRSTSIAPTLNGGTSPMAVQQKGLDEATLSGYPNFPFAQVMCRRSDATALGCSICLAEYKDTDTIRLLPDCGHFFHRNCVDRWLMLHPTCPVCRTSPLRISMA